MHYPKYLKWGVIIGLFVTLFLPFVVATGLSGNASVGGNWFNIFNVLFPINSFFPYITGKNFVFRIVVEVVLALYILLALKDPKYRPRSSPLLFAVGLFVLWMGVATAFSLDPVKSFWSNFERMDGFINLIHMGALFVVAGMVLHAENLWERFFIWSVGASMLQGVYALLQVMNWFGFTPTSQSGARADTSFGNATYLAVYMLFNIFLALYLLLRNKHSPWMQSFLGLALVLQFVALYFTETRGAILGVVGGLLVAALYIVIFEKGVEWRTVRKTALGGLAVIVLVVAGFFAAKDTAFIKSYSTLNRLASISLTDLTTQSRFTIWGQAWKGFSESPRTVVVGWGQENFSYVFNKYYEPSMWSQEQWFDRAHNEFIDWAIAGGLPAFLLYLSFFILAGLALWRSSLSVPEQAVLFGMLAGYGFNNLLVFDNLLSMMYFFLILAFMHGISQKKLPAWMFMSRPAHDHTLAVAAPVVAVAVLLGGWALNAPAIARAQGLIVALSQQTDPKINLAKFDELLSAPLWPGTGLGKQEATEQLFQVASSIAPSSVSPETKAAFYALAKEKGEELLSQRQNDARLELFMGSMLRVFGDYPNALLQMQAALANSPRKQQILFGVGQVYLQQGNMQEALKAFKTAYDEAPEYATARILYAQGLYFAGQNVAADALLVEGFGSVTADNDQLIQIYGDLKMYARVVAIWQARVNKNPNDAELRLGLASAYFSAGNNQGAIAQLREMARLNPQAAAQVENIITQIQNGTLKP